MTNILAGLETFLYVISSALFYPVIAGLVLLTLWIVTYFGGFLREYIERRQAGGSVLSQYKRTLESEIGHSDTNPPAHNLPRSGEAELEVRLERLLQERELELVKSLDRIRFVVRVGPALGLMGTLIPMGIALSALAQGDMPKMAGSMVTAFTTTVVGLACGVAAYLMSMLKERWIRADMREMEYITELSLRNSKLGFYKEEKDEISEETEKV